MAALIRQSVLRKREGEAVLDAVEGVAFPVVAAVLLAADAVVLADVAACLPARPGHRAVEEALSPKLGGASSERLSIPMPTLQITTNSPILGRRSRES